MKRSTLLREVSRAVLDPAEMDEEIYALCDASLHPKGRLGP